LENSISAPRTSIGWAVMKCKYRLRTKKPMIILVLLILAIFAAVFVGFNFSAVKGLFGGDNGGQQDIDDTAAQQAWQEEAQQARQEAAQQGLLILVNKQYPVDQGYKPDDLVAMKYYAPELEASFRYLREPAAAAFNQLVETAELDGIELTMASAYRSYDYQKIIFDNYVSQYGEEEANTFSAKPGQSEHQTGLAVDVSSPSTYYELTEAYGDTPEGKWLSGHAHEFGFILRYPKGKEAITGYTFEPWHLRFVGLFVAKEIYNQDITLEEYLMENDLEDGAE
jgi:zinc D-Ala-D-Ala carboxypeptidase